MRLCVLLIHIFALSSMSSCITSRKALVVFQSGEPAAPAVTSHTHIHTALHSVLIHVCKYFSVCWNVFSLLFVSDRNKGIFADCHVLPGFRRSTSVGRSGSVISFIFNISFTKQVCDIFDDFQ